MANIDRAYVTLALALLIIGTLLGLYMGIANDMRYRSVHITMVLPGFVTLAIYGFMFRLWPGMKAGPLAAAQFWLGALSTIGLVIGSYLFVATGGIVFIALSSVVAILAVALLAWLFWTRSVEA
jgi:hypothetical protein